MHNHNFRDVSRNFLASNSSSGTHIRVEGISKSFPDRRVLTDVSLAVSAGECACLVGENGSGKTTLLRIIAGLDEDYEGEVQVPGQVGFYHQEIPFPLSWSVDEVLMDAMVEHRQVLARIEEAAARIALGEDQAGQEYDDALAHAERIGAWEIEAVSSRLLDGFGLADIDRTREVVSLSGGQRARLSLAWLLIRSPETLLLDEPTNHLDDRGTDLLASMVVSWRGPVLLASHDRAFLDQVATTILDLDPSPSRHVDTIRDESPGSGFGVSKYSGSYSDYLEARAQERERWEQQYRDEQEQLKELQARVARGHAVDNPSRPPKSEVRMAAKFYSDRNAKVVSRRVNDAERALEQLRQEQVRKPPEQLTFSGLAAARADSHDGGGDDRTVFVGTNLGYSNRLRPTSVTIRHRDRLLITGENGSGKSTLLKIIGGRLGGYEGSVNAPSRLRVNALAQDVGTILKQKIAGRDWRELSVSDAYRQAVGEELSARVGLNAFGLLSGRDHNRPVGSLSTGQQRRLELAVLLADPPDILLLDEPTNHFSLKLTTELEDSIASYPGAVVVASHDRWLRQRWEGRVLHLRSVTEKDG